MDGLMQGTNVDVFASQPGLVQTQLNGRKLDHSKLTAIAVDLAAKAIGQTAEKASYCLQRPASDNTVAGESHVSIALLRACRSAAESEEVAERLC